MSAMLAARVPLTPATTMLKLSNVPSAICRAIPVFGAPGLTYSKCAKPGWYLRSPNSDSPCRQFFVVPGEAVEGGGWSWAAAGPIQAGTGSRRAASAKAAVVSSERRFTGRSYQKTNATRCLWGFRRRRQSADGSASRNAVHIRVQCTRMPYTDGGCQALSMALSAPERPAAHCFVRPAGCWSAAIPCHPPALPARWWACFQLTAPAHWCRRADWLPLDHFEALLPRAWQRQRLVGVGI